MSGTDGATAASQDSVPDDAPRTRRGLTLMLASNVTLLVLEAAVLVAVLLALVAAGSLAAGSAGGLAGGIVGLLITLVVLLLGLLVWIVLAVVAVLFLFLGRDEIGDPHARYVLVGIALIVAGAIGTAATPGGMILGSAFTEASDVGALAGAAGFGVGLAGLAGQILLVFGLATGSTRNLLYAYGGLGAGGGAASLAASLGGVPALALGAAGLGIAAQVAFLLALLGIRHAMQDGDRPAQAEVDDEAEPETVEAEAEPAPSPDGEGPLVVACSKCGAHLEVTGTERPLVVRCSQCGTQGVVKAPPPGADREAAGVPEEE